MRCTRVLLSAVVALALSGPASAQSHADAVLAAQNTWMRAFAGCSANDMAAVVTDDMVFMHSAGNADDRPQFLTYVSQCTITGLTGENQKVRVYGDDAAVATGKIVFKTKGGDGTMIVTQVWVKQDGTWRMASHQTTVPPPARR